MSPLHDALTKYVAIRRALGAQLREPAVTLARFIDFLESEGAEFITSQLALRWATEPSGVEPSTWARRLGMVRRFATWWSTIDPRTQIPPKGLLKARHRRKRPHIFTEHQIEQLMGQAARLPSSKGLRALTYGTLIGLLAATGLRPGEALSLDGGDVDLQTGILAVRNTKFGKSRFVPIEDSTRAALARYAKRRDRLFSQRRTEAFLVSERGVRLVCSTARHTFARLCRTIGLRSPMVGRRIGRGPRLQDLRHTFATRKLVEWYRAGLDVEKKIPGLTTYLGHSSVQNTYWYIQAIPELLQLATEHQTTRRQEDDR